MEEENLIANEIIRLYQLYSPAIKRLFYRLVYHWTPYFLHCESTTSFVERRPFRRNVSDFLSSISSSWHVATAVPHLPVVPITRATRARECRGSGWGRPTAHPFSYLKNVTHNQSRVVFILSSLHLNKSPTAME